MSLMPDTDIRRMTASVGAEDKSREMREMREETEVLRSTVEEQKLHAQRKRCSLR